MCSGTVTGTWFLGKQHFFHYVDVRVSAESLDYRLPVCCLAFAIHSTSVVYFLVKTCMFMIYFTGGVVHLFGLLAYK